MAALARAIQGRGVPRYVTGANGVTDEIWEPTNGDPQVNPRPTYVQPSAERLPFTRSGELLPRGPVLPADYLHAPDVDHLPWVRKRGDEWTDEPFRAAVLTWLVPTLAARGNPTWRIIEKASATRSGRLPDDECYLLVRIGDSEVAQRFPPGTRAGAALAAKLAQILASLS